MANEYVKKSCYDCGKRDFQPNMKRVVQETTNVSTNFNRKTKKATSTRLSSTQRKVFVCKECAEKRENGQLMVWVWMIVIGFIIFLMIS